MPWVIRLSMTWYGSDIVVLGAALEVIVGGYREFFVRLKLLFRCQALFRVLAELLRGRARVLSGVRRGGVVWRSVCFWLCNDAFVYISSLALFSPCSFI